MSADSSFRPGVLLAQRYDLEDRLSPTTRLLYERNMRTLVLRFFKEVPPGDRGGPLRLLPEAAREESYNRARQARVVLRLALALAVRHEIIPNPMDHVSRLRRPARTPDVFTWDELKAIGNQRLGAATNQGRPETGRATRSDRGNHARHLSTHRRTPRDPPGRPQSEAPIPSVRISGTIVSRGEPTHRQIIPRQPAVVRRVALPGFAFRAIQSASSKFTSPTRTRCCSQPAPGHRTRLTMSAGSSAT